MTLSLVIGAIILTAIFSVVLGILAARRGGAVDGTVQFLSILGFAIPGFLIALFLVLIFAINLGWFKATGYIPLTDVLHRLAEQRDAADHRPGHRRYRHDLAAGSRFGARRPVPRLRPHAPQPRTQFEPRRLQARPPQRRWSRARPPGGAVHRHDRRCGDRRADLRPPGYRFAHRARRPPQGDIPVVMGIVIITAIIAVVVNLLIDLAQAALNPKVRLS